jgi:ketosteroid isomerase-like protein
MSADSNIEVVKGIYEAFGTGDVDTILAACTDDVDWAADATGSDAPWWGQRNGKDEVAGFFAGIAESTEPTEFSPLSFAANDTEVMVLLRYGSRNKATGKEATMNIHHYFRFRDGKVEHYRGSEDTQLTAETFAA